MLDYENNYLFNILIFLVKQRLHEQFNDQEEKVIIFALESTDYNEALAGQILKNYLDNEIKTKEESDG